MRTILHLLVTPSDVKNGRISKDPSHAVPGLEMARPEHGNVIAEVEAMMSPRMMKTHLQYSFMSRAVSMSKVKVIVVIRNPKDVMVSFYHFYRMFSHMGNYSGGWNHFFDMFMAGKVAGGSWFQHTLSWWDIRKQPNVLIITYEDMIANLLDIIQQVAVFIEKEVSTEHAQKIAEMTSFKYLKKELDPIFEQSPTMNQKVSPFMRKGEIGDWKNYFTVAQNELFDKLFKQRFAACDLKFKFE